MHYSKGREMAGNRIRLDQMKTGSGSGCEQASLFI